MLRPIVGRLRRSVNAIEGGMLRMLNVECLFVIDPQDFQESSLIVDRQIVKCRI